MPLDLTNLDQCTRRYMLAELEADIATGMLYYSPHLTDVGHVRYHELLRAAIEAGTEASFADALLETEAVRPPDRWYRADATERHDAITATAELLAEREFHRFYIRGLCRRAVRAGVPTLVIYRARPAAAGRGKTDVMVGVNVTAASLLEDLSCRFQTSPPHGLPQCRDPGLSVRLP